MPNRIQRFTTTARSALAIAHVEAKNLQQTFVGPEHLLLGLMRDEHTGAAEVLKELKLDIDTFRQTISELTASQPQPESKRLDLSDQAKRVLEFTVDETRRLGAHSVGSAHLLLGLMRLEDGIMIE